MVDGWPVQESGPTYVELAVGSQIGDKYTMPPHWELRECPWPGSGAFLPDEGRSAEITGKSARVSSQARRAYRHVCGCNSHDAERTIT